MFVNHRRLIYECFVLITYRNFVRLVLHASMYRSPDYFIRIMKGFDVARFIMIFSPIY